MPNESGAEALEALMGDPELLLSTIDEALERLSPFDLPVVELAAEAGEGEHYRSVKDGHPRYWIVDLLLDRQRDFWIDHICAKYCARKEHHEKKLDVLKAVFDGLISAHFSLPLPVATLAVYAVQSGFLDRICKCGQ